MRNSLEKRMAKETFQLLMFLKTSFLVNKVFNILFKLKLQ